MSDPDQLQEQYPEIPEELIALEAAIDKELSEILQPTRMSDDTPSTSETFTVGTFSFDVNIDNPTINPPMKVGRLHTKEYRPIIGSKEETALITKITTNQYDKYKMIESSLKDTESLKSNLSITQRLQMTQDCWELYDLLDPCNIVFPCKSNNAELQKENGTVKFRNLFTHHRRISVSEVAASCEYYQKYVTFKGNKDTTCTFAKELTWSYNHFRSHVDATLYDTVNTEFRLFAAGQQGGPLFLKLLLNQLVVSNEASLEALILTTTTYDIKTMNTSEDIIEVIKLLSSITNTIVAIRDDVDHPLPENYIQKVLKVFQTTSVEAFNSSFKKLEDDLVFNRRFKRTANATALTAQGGLTFLPSSTSTGLQLDNTIRSSIFLWTFARETYKELKENGKWDAEIRTPGSSTFVVRCWNCGDPDHNFPQCPDPINDAKVDKERKLFRDSMNEKDSEGGRPRRRQRSGAGRKPWEWRVPSDDEHGKRIIYGKPYTWNASTKRWDKDETPESGLTAATPPAPPLKPPQQATGTVQSEDDMTAMTQSTMPPLELAHLQLEIANFAQQINRYQQSP